MLDERDALLLREFAQSERPLADAQFVAQVRDRLHVFSARRLLGVAVAGALRAIFTGLSFGVVAPLQMRHAGLVALAALGMALWSIVRSSL
ncbi:MAG TPA: hypothetical protein VEC59_09405 [Steroidobacteraceae bacterium]|nr:hypothetical protein [Steroidobacteraceae bacterium]